SPWIGRPAHRFCGPAGRCGDRPDQRTPSSETPMRRAPVLAVGLVLALSAPARADLFFSRQLTETSGEVIRYDVATPSVVQTLPVAVRDIDGLALDPASGNLF